jgi:membrane protein
MGELITPNKRGLPVVVDFFKEIYRIWISERPMQLAAALAYFGLFSFAPVIYIAFTIASLVFRRADILEAFVIRLGDALGPELVQAILTMLNTFAWNGPASSGGTLLGALLSIIFLLYAASGVFYQLQYALNSIWKVSNPSQGTLKLTVRKQLFSFLMVITIGLLLVAAAAFSFFANWLSSTFLSGNLLPSLTFVGFLGLAMFSFAVMYKLLPDVKISWRDVWGGAAAAAFLVTLGGWLILFLVKNFNLSSALEAAGSFVILLSGFYYFSQIFLFGAIFSRVYAHRFGSLHQAPATSGKSISAS